MKEPQPHQTRVLSEQIELSDRLEKLTAFTGTDLFFMIPKEEQSRLHRQRKVMREYLTILNERIEAFGVPAETQLLEIVAGDLYDHYSKAVGGKAFNGDPLPDWNTFRNDPAKGKQSGAWASLAGHILKSY